MSLGLCFPLLSRPALIYLRATLLGLSTVLLPGSQMIIGSQVQEHRFEVWLDRGEFEDVQTLLGQHPGDDLQGRAAGCAD